MRCARSLNQFTCLALLAAAVGCQHANRSTIEQCDSKVGVPVGWLHDSPCVAAKLAPVSAEPDQLTPPRTILNPEAGEIWELPLADAIAIALRNSDVVRVLGGNAVSTHDTTIYEPAVAEADIQAALARFDTNWNTEIFWNRIDQPPGVRFGGGIPVPNQRDQASFRSALTKLLATGGTAGIAFNTDYLFIPPFPSVSRSPGPDGIFGTIDDVVTISQQRTPALYSPNLELTLTQPLLKNAGRDFNRSDIVIARLESDQSLWSFKEAVLSQVRSVEEAYWSLYAQHGSLRAVEDVIPLLQELVRIREAEVEFQKGRLDELAEARTRLAELRRTRIQAMGSVLESENTLRDLLGMPPSDTRRLLPTDLPHRVPVVVDWEATIQTAVDNRPDVVRNRLALRIRELQLLKANNALQPELNLSALWRVNGLDNELDEAIGLLTDNQFTDWQLGVTLAIPLGFRQASAAVHVAELQLDKERALLRQKVHASVHEISKIVRDLDRLILEYQIAEESLTNSRQWVEIARTRASIELAEEPLTSAQNLYIQAIESYRSAATQTYLLLAQYNTALVRLEEAKGTLLSTSGIQLAEDPIARLRYQESRLPGAPSPLGAPTPPATPSNAP